ncbi:unnamed protein product [Bemisia tabaci]|uniref:Phenazine biosynthesis PhzC/PhzF protein n=1 Tax=Bemisia tabaci TaxID=7038 RepID=A0A9P0AHQ5_BEMTA|nr:unnamed protein product [Bemisia tabaci]
MLLEFHQVDAFADGPFTGNPAAVYRLEIWPSDDLLQKIAQEYNPAVTVFVAREGTAWRIRWFVPREEVKICGHGTLAAAHVLFTVYGIEGDQLEFVSHSGPLRVSRGADRLTLDFPALVPKAVVVPDLERILGAPPLEVLEDGDCKLLVRLVSERSVREVAPDLHAVAGLPYQGVIVTAAGEEVDFVSRYFAPAVGLNEDAVCGSAHCSLTPFWARRLGKEELIARQLSPRGGRLRCRFVSDRVHISGKAVTVLAGRFLI